ncbi:proton-conducting transporter membrane subunit [Pseudonocardia sp. KRD291]|uniref:NADH-quinone oxidoreductase subunit 5 family protein n=1 Tax=Pseudonocardia sp. KRD291 TaxID=2792007 RepID=UPI001C5C7FCD|nr:proton-conducting transporter membrane subunit [Pseudonocardia sp. KRD291]MBW0102967.1 NADH-quinone oxidoreductase subunit L [Pseudonocardia sp. KRD291]
MLLWSLVGLPVLAGAALALARPGATRAAVPAGVLVAAAIAVLAVAASVTRPVASAPLLAGIRAELAVDGLSAAMVLTVAGALLAVLLVAAGEPELRTGRFVGLMLIFAGAMLGTVTAVTLAPLLMAWEVMGATSWALIGYHHRDTDAARAASTAFLTTRTGDLGLYLAAGAALAGGVGSLALAELPAARGGWLHVVAAGIVLAALGKSAQLPFSFWLSGAMRGPSPVSALLHSATMVAAGAYLLLRLAPLLGASGWAGPLVAWVGAATALLLGLVAVAQSDLKQLLAASTCAQIGFMVLAAGVGGSSAGVLQLIAHAATKSLLFLAAGAWLVALGTKRLGGLAGAARRFPLVGAAFTVGALSLAGLPPLGLWVAKDTVLAAALQRSVALYAVGLAGAVVAAVYSVRALWFVWQPAAGPVEPAASAAPAEVLEQRPTGQVAPVVAPVLLVLAVGAAGAGLLVFGSGVLAPSPAPASWELVVSALVAFAAAGLAWRRGARIPAPAAWLGWLGLEQAAHRLLVRPTLALAGVLARVDDRVLDRGVDAAARATVRAARGLDRRGEGAVDGAVRGLADGARVLGRWARRPQTGQLHQYYAQASVGFALLAALAVVLIVVR